MDRINELARMIDHSILHPAFTDDDLVKQCEIAHKYKVASVCVKPYAVKRASELLKESDVDVGCVIGFPHGNSSIKVKVFEAEQACLEGATEIDMVINIGKALSGDWTYIEEEIVQVTNICHLHHSIIKVIFETDFITSEQDKIQLCKICTRAGSDFVKTSTGYGFVKLTDGNYNYTGATVNDIELMHANCGPGVKIKAAGGVRNLDDLLKVKAAGASRVGATATQVILEEAKKRYTNL
jgi:deoxyribose-phosphate aldolase